MPAPSLTPRCVFCKLYGFTPGNHLMTADKEYLEGPAADKDGCFSDGMCKRAETEANKRADAWLLRQGGQPHATYK